MIIPQNEILPGIYAHTKDKVLFNLLYPYGLVELAMLLDITPKALYCALPVLSKIDLSHANRTRPRAEEPIIWYEGNTPVPGHGFYHWSFVDANAMFGRTFDKIKDPIERQIAIRHINYAELPVGPRFKAQQALLKEIEATTNQEQLLFNGFTQSLKKILSLNNKLMYLNDLQNTYSHDSNVEIGRLSPLIAVLEKMVEHPKKTSDFAQNSKNQRRIAELQQQLSLLQNTATNHLLRDPPGNAGKIQKQREKLADELTVTFDDKRFQRQLYALMANKQEKVIRIVAQRLFPEIEQYYRAISTSPLREKLRLEVEEVISLFTHQINRKLDYEYFPLDSPLSKSEQEVKFSEETPFLLKLVAMHMSVATNQPGADSLLIGVLKLTTPMLIQHAAKQYQRGIKSALSLRMLGCVMHLAKFDKIHMIRIWGNIKSGNLVQVKRLSTEIANITVGNLVLKGKISTLVTALLNAVLTFEQLRNGKLDQKDKIMLLATSMQTAASFHPVYRAFFKKPIRSELYNMLDDPLAKSVGVKIADTLAKSAAIITLFFASSDVRSAVLEGNQHDIMVSSAKLIGTLMTVTGTLLSWTAVGTVLVLLGTLISIIMEFVPSYSQIRRYIENQWKNFTTRKSILYVEAHRDKASSLYKVWVSCNDAVEKNSRFSYAIDPSQMTALHRLGLPPGLVAALIAEDLNDIKSALGSPPPAARKVRHIPLKC